MCLEDPKEFDIARAELSVMITRRRELNSGIQALVKELQKSCRHLRIAGTISQPGSFRRRICLDCQVSEEHHQDSFTVLVSVPGEIISLDEYLRLRNYEVMGVGKKNPVPIDEATD